MRLRFFLPALFFLGLLMGCDKPIEKLGGPVTLSSGKASSEALYFFKVNLNANQ